VRRRSIDVSELISLDVAAGGPGESTATAEVDRRIGCKAGSRFAGSKDEIFGGIVVVASPSY
jgi:hypothetical protein